MYLLIAVHQKIGLKRFVLLTTSHYFSNCYTSNALLSVDYYSFFSDKELLLFISNIIPNTIELLGTVRQPTSIQENTEDLVGAEDSSPVEYYHFAMFEEEPLISVVVNMNF